MLHLELDGKVDGVLNFQKWANMLEQSHLVTKSHTKKKC